MADRWIVNSHVLSRTAELFVSLKSNNAELSDLGLMSSIKRVRKHHALLRAQTYVSYQIPKFRAESTTQTVKINRIAEDEIQLLVS